MDEEIIGHLPKAYQAFYKICNEAGIKFEDKDVHKNDRNSIN